MICAFSYASIFPSTAFAQDQEDETVTVDGTDYRTSMPFRWFSIYTDFGEKLRFGTVNDGNEAGFFSLGLDIKKHLSDKDDEKWDEALCHYYMYPECIKILSDYKENGTMNFALGLLYLSGVPNRNISKNQNFLDSDLEKSKILVGRAADRGLPEALNFRALVTLVEWGTVNPNAEVFKIPPSAEQDLKAAASQGYAAAKLNLAGLSMDRKNYAEARAIYEELSAGGLADAHYALGVIYLAGYGVPSNYVKAREYFSRAAPNYYKSGRGIEATYNLGMMYFTGLGGSTDYNLARRWVGNAAKAKFEPAVAALAGIEKARQNEANGLAAPKATSIDSRQKEIACPEEKISVPQNSAWRTDVDLVVVPYPSEIEPNQRRQWAQKIDIEQTFLSLFGGTSFSISCQFQSKSSVCSDAISAIGYNPRAGKAEIFGQNILRQVQNVEEPHGYSGHRLSNDFRIRDKSGRFFIVQHLDKIKTEYSRPSGGTNLVSDGYSSYMISFDFVRFDAGIMHHVEPSHFIVSRSKSYHAFCKEEKAYVPNF
jgi:TPR repeat protein